MAKRKKPKTLGYRLRRIAILMLVVIAGAAVWGYLAPTLTAQAVLQYTPYQVENRTVTTSMSFGGTVSILHSEAFTVTESTTVRELYVQAAQEVSKGDKLMLLENGELMKAGIDGVVNQMRVSAGSWVPPNMTLLQVCDLTNMQISMNVDEYDITSISIGQPCVVTVVSLGLSFDAEIAHVNRMSTANGSVAYYTAGIELTVPPEVLPGMQATITIVQDEAVDVPTLPMAALSFDEDGTPYVYVDGDDGEYVRQEIELGINDGMYVQVTNGLSAGQQVYTAATVQVESEGFSLSGLYKKLVGETVVIRETSTGRGGRGGEGGGMPSGEMPEGFSPENMPEGFDPENMPGAQTGEAATETEQSSKATPGDQTTEAAQGEQTDEEATQSNQTGEAATQADQVADATQDNQTGEAATQAEQTEQANTENQPAQTDTSQTGEAAKPERPQDGAQRPQRQQSDNAAQTDEQTDTQPTATNNKED